MRCFFFFPVNCEFNQHVIFSSSDELICEGTMPLPFCIFFFSSSIARWSMSTNPCCFDSGSAEKISCHFNTYVLLHGIATVLFLSLCAESVGTADDLGWRSHRRRFRWRSLTFLKHIIMGMCSVFTDIDTILTLFYMSGHYSGLEASFDADDFFEFGLIWGYIRLCKETEIVWQLFCGVNIMCT